MSSMVPSPAAGSSASRPPTNGPLAAEPPAVEPAAAEPAAPEPPDAESTIAEPAATDRRAVDDAEPWAMQLVVRLERVDPPSATAVLEAAATAVVELLADERAAAGGPWAEEVGRWQHGRIRKLARRARGSAWDRVQSQPGITVKVSGAEVRAVVPGPVDDMAADLRKLQVAGLDLDDPDRRLSFRPPPGWPGVVIAVDSGLSMSTGKLAAQAGHAAHLAWQAMAAARRAQWADAGFALTVIRPDPVGWGDFLSGAPVVVTDGGFTEIAPGSRTAAASWA